MTRLERVLGWLCAVATLFNLVWLSSLTRYANDVIPARTMFRSGADFEEIVLEATGSRQVGLSASESGTAFLSIRSGDDRIIISCGDKKTDPVILMTRGRAGISIGFDSAGAPQIIGTDANGNVTVNVR